MVRKLYWGAVNGGLFAGAYYGFFRGVDWASNITVFFLWVNIVMLTFFALNTEIKKIAKKKGRSVPRWLSVASDIAMIAILAAVGRFFLAGAQFWQMMCEAAIFDGKEETP